MCTVGISLWDPAAEETMCRTMPRHGLSFVHFDPDIAENKSSQTIVQPLVTVKTPRLNEFFLFFFFFSSFRICSINWVGGRLYCSPNLQTRFLALSGFTTEEQSDSVPHLRKSQFRVLAGRKPKMEGRGFLNPKIGLPDSKNWDHEYFEAHSTALRHVYYTSPLGSFSQKNLEFLTQTF